MRSEPLRLISQESPKALRRRRQAQQRSGCCCCLMVVVSLVVVAIAFRGSAGQLLGRVGKGRHYTQPKVLFPLALSSDQKSYPRYALIPLRATVVDYQGQPVVADEAPLITVLHNGEIVTTVGSVKKLRLRYDRGRQQYYAYWPVPWNADPGYYTAEARIEIKDPENWPWRTEQEARKAKDQDEFKMEGPTWCVAQVRFEIAAAAQPEFQPGTCIATWEPDFRAEGIPKPGGGSGDWRTMLDWCDYIGADTFWFRGAVTEAYTGKLSMEQPFDVANLEAIPKLAAEAHRRGLKFGVWAVAYSTYPRANKNKPPYAYAIDISRSSGATSAHNFISLLDERRIDHLAAFVSQMEQLEDVDFIGFDYFRSDRGGYEMVDRFANEMPVSLPDKWAGMSQRQRMLYVANKIEAGGWQRNPDFYDCWNWWRAHLGAHILRRVRDKSQATKPMWVFVLSWRHGVQHGQDPLMLTDAGVTVLAPMLYQVPDRLHFDTMTKEWNQYLRPDQVNLVVGDQVDFYWHQKTLVPAAPEELYDHIVTAHADYQPGDGVTQGAFWHDVSRAALWGNMGPYPGREWALAGAAAFTTVRSDWGVYPLQVRLNSLERTSGSRFTASLAIENLSHKEITGIEVRLMDTPHIQSTDKAQRRIKGLGPKETILVPFEGRITGPSSARGNRFMVALRVTWPPGEYGKQFRADLPCQQTVMKYLQLGSGAPKKAN